nr:pilus assembly protein PilP [Acinetobacter sp. Marseille-Q1620]
MSFTKVIFIFLLGGLFAGCDSKIDTVNKEMAKIHAEKPMMIEPAPEFEVVPSFSYSAGHLRSPFIPSSLANELKAMEGKRVYPDFSRQPQSLEKYPLESLKMKGTLKNKSGPVVALIQAPDGEVERVTVGNYMGLNQGRIVNITAQRVDLLEVVPDGRDGYIERPRTLVLLSVK